MPDDIAVKPPPKEEKPSPSKLRDPAPYVVTDVRQELCWPADDAELSGILKGARTPLSARKLARGRPGDTVTGLPASSVPGLLARGWIVKPGQPWRIAHPVEVEGS